MPSESRIDVLIIGAGPAGLMCANALVTAGVNVRIIDKRSTKVGVGQADGIQPRTMEILQSYGLADRLLQEGNQMHMIAFYNSDGNGGTERTKLVPGVRGSTPRYPFQITHHQGGIESIFLDSIERRGIQVERPSQPTAIEISDDIDELLSPSSYPVKVTVEHLSTRDEKSRTEVIHAKYVVGSDGAHSWVRRTLGIDMNGEQSADTWGVIDMTPETNFPDVRNLTILQSTLGTCKIIPREDDKVRLYVQLSDADVVDPSTGRVEKSGITPQKLLSVFRKVIHPFEWEHPKYIEWWTVYTIGQRVASTYSVKDRVFIAGDACHTHSPKAGQGMNASMGDAHNLAWKLVQVLKGWSRQSLLKSYEHERRNYALDLISFDKKAAAVFGAKPKTEESDDGVSNEQYLQMFRTFEDFTSGIGICYPPSAIVDLKHQACASGLVIGQRMRPQILVRAADARPIEIQDLLVADVRFKLLFFVGHLTETRIAELNSLADELSESSRGLNKYTTDENISTVFDIITIAAGKKETINYLHVPQFFRPHWSKVLLDDTDVTGTQGGNAYETFGIDPKQIMIVVVRPDGHIGTIVPSTNIGDMEGYFDSFLVLRTRVA